MIIWEPFTHGIKNIGVKPRVNFVMTLNFTEPCLIIKMGIPKLSFHLVWILSEIICLSSIRHSTWYVVNRWELWWKVENLLLTILHTSVDLTCILFLPNIYDQDPFRFLSGYYSSVYMDTQVFAGIRRCETSEIVKLIVWIFCFNPILCQLVFTLFILS